MCQAIAICASQPMAKAIVRIAHRIHQSANEDEIEDVWDPHHGGEGGHQSQVHQLGSHDGSPFFESLLLIAIQG
jgi:hypothetical protein